VCSSIMEEGGGNTGHSISLQRSWDFYQNFTVIYTRTYTVSYMPQHLAYP
jgi:hypothetical protein